MGRSCGYLGVQACGGLGVLLGEEGVGRPGALHPGRQSQSGGFPTSMVLGLTREVGEEICERKDC